MDGGRLQRRGARALTVALLLSSLLTPIARGIDRNIDLPPDPQLRELVGHTLLAFDAAVQHKDFTAFYQLTSTALSAQMSADDLRAAFHDFIDRRANLSGISGGTPVWDMPPSLHDGTLQLRGRYLTAPMQVLFAIKYVNETRDWKVQGIDVKLKRVETPPSALPADATAATRPTTTPTDAPRPEAPVDIAEANQLARQTLLLFSGCVKADDFTPLYDSASAAFKAQVSPKRLSGAFKQFIAKHIDLSPIARLQPREIEEPHLDDKHVLTVHGRYATSPMVLFQARYIQEAGAWKLLGLSVRTEEPATKPTTP